MKFAWKETFHRDYKKLPDDIKQHVKEALSKFEENERSGTTRSKKQRGYKNPSVFAIHITGNHAYKLSFEYGPEDTILLRRVGTHKQIDKAA